MIPNVPSSRERRPAVIIQSGTDLAPLRGRRVAINGVRHALIADIQHCAGSTSPELRGGMGSTCIEDPHGECRGGSTAFWWPYGTDLTLENDR